VNSGKPPEKPRKEPSDPEFFIRRIEGKVPTAKEQETQLELGAVLVWGGDWW
jgi:hypothetical protein